MKQSKVVQNKGGVGIGSPYALPGYEYDPVNDNFKDLESGKIFNKNGGAKLEANKLMTIASNGTVLVTPSPTYDGMEKVTLDVQVPQGGDIEANKDVTIDVSAYTEPVEVTPTAGKDGMAKATITLDNIPSGGATTPLYAWKNGSNIAYTLTPNPASGLGMYEYNATDEIYEMLSNIWNTDGSSYITWDEATYERDSSEDIVISGPVYIRCYYNVILPAGQKIYMFAGHNPSTGTEDVFCIDTDGENTVGDLFHTAGAEGSPTYAGTMGNVHFFTAYTG